MATRTSVRMPFENIRLQFYRYFAFSFLYTSIVQFISLKERIFPTGPSGEFVANATKKLFKKCLGSKPLFL